MTRGVGAALRRQRALTVAALVCLVALAWAWLLLGAGMDMAPHAALDLFPHATTPAMEMGAGMDMDMAPAGWGVAEFTLAVSMWWVMMIAMMLPAAAPVILLYDRTAQRSLQSARPATGSFLAGYLAIWALFSLLAAALQWALQRSDLLAPETLGSMARWFSAAVLFAAGLYQLSPYKEACLRHCRNPASFLTRHYRPGRVGAFRLGAIHGSYCVGCCWLLMALLFVGGVMNLAWIALLSVLVAGEKLLPGGRWLAIAAGVAFIAWAGLTAFG